MGGHWRSCVAKHFDDVISFALPTIFQQTSPVGRVMDFFPIHRNLALTGGDRPNNGHVVFFAAAVRSVSACCQRLGIGITETPSTPRIDGQRSRLYVDVERYTKNNIRAVQNTFENNWSPSLQSKSRRVVASQDSFFQAQNSNNEDPPKNSPSHFPLRRGNAFSCCNCRKVNLVGQKLWRTHFFQMFFAFASSSISMTASLGLLRFRQLGSIPGKRCLI